MSETSEPPESETLEAGTKIGNLIEGHSYLVVGMGYAPAFGAFYQCVHEGPESMNRVAIPAQWLHEDHTFAVEKPVVGPEAITAETDTDEAVDEDDDLPDDFQESVERVASDWQESVESDERETTDTSDYEPPNRDERKMIEDWIAYIGLDPDDFEIDIDAKDEVDVIRSKNLSHDDYERWVKYARRNDVLRWNKEDQQIEVAIEDVDLLEAVTDI